MTGISVITDEITGLTEFFGGPKAMQNHIRMKMTDLKKMIEKALADIPASKKELKIRYQKALRVINRALDCELIFDGHIADVCEILYPGTDIRIHYQDFIKVVVPENETEELVWQKIQNQMSPDPVAKTNFLFIAASMKAISEMGRILNDEATKQFVKKLKRRQTEFEHKVFPVGTSDSEIACFVNSLNVEAGKRVADTAVAILPDGNIDLSYRIVPC